MNNSTSSAAARLIARVSVVTAGAPHGMCTTEADRINADLLAFIESQT
ncbi:hypothetical protein P3T23_005632 [Paraburkholderia sp. GAS448]